MTNCLNKLANSVDTDQTAPARSSLIRVHNVCNFMGSFAFRHKLIELVSFEINMVFGISCPCIIIITVNSQITGVTMRIRIIIYLY